MKKFLYIILLLSLVILPAFALEETDESLEEKIASIGFGKIFATDPQKEITNMFKKLDEYALKKDFKNIRQFYSDDFVNNDGFDIDLYMKSIKSGFESYDNKVIATTINSISVNDDYAIVHVNENQEAETVKTSEKTSEKGLILASSDVYYYLKRDGKKWKITSANIIDENCAILYGTAKNIYFNLNVPTQVKAGSEYTSSLSFMPMKDTLVLASLSTEPIVYPLPTDREAYKTVKGDGILERIFKANSENLNEYAIASIGLSKPKMISATDFQLEFVGTAYVVRRVNVFKTYDKKTLDKHSKNNTKKE